jgi:uncharacterized protein
MRNFSLRPSLPAVRSTIGVTVQDVVSERVPPQLDGVRIGQLSDIHVRAGVRPRRLEEAVDRMNALRPHFVVLTGDYVCTTALPSRKLTHALRRLEMPAFATLGNHDHWAGASKIRGALEAAGVEVLCNEHRVIRIQGHALHLVGMDDAFTRHHDADRAYAGVHPEATVVALSHDPNGADVLSPFRPALILSGHTHGGQIYVRRLTELISRRIGIKYLAGFYDVGGAILFVNRGLGASVPVRFRAPSEIAVLTLRTLRAQVA